LPSFFSVWLRRQIKTVKPVLAKFDLETSRNVQDNLGRFLSRVISGKVEYLPVENWDEQKAVWIIPREDEMQGHVLYLHGGGYVSGSLNYAKMYGSVLAAACGRKIFCLAYDLAPEHPFPAALNDAVDAYKHMLKSGVSPSKIAVAGESAGGGLVFCLMHKLKREGLPMPACLISISPWADLTLSGASHSANRRKDVALSTPQLAEMAILYAPGDLTNELVSPIFGSFAGFPPALIFAGGDEVLLDDAKAVKRCYDRAKIKARLVVEKGMWHVYPLYRTTEAIAAVNMMTEFLSEHLCNE
jgi:monoterpene epsilon-lactone hydrolase